MNHPIPLILCTAILTSSPCLYAGEAEPQSVKDKLKAANAADHEGDLATAKRILEDVLRDEPASVEAMQVLAAVARQECRWEDGLNLLKRAQSETRSKKEIARIEKEAASLETSRLYASPDVYCGPRRRMKAPKPIRKVEPQCPTASAARPKRTSSYLWIEIGTDGIPSNLQVLPNSAAGEYAVEATRAVDQWRFEPATVDGKPIKIIARVEVNFVCLAQQ